MMFSEEEQRKCLTPRNTLVRHESSITYHSKVAVLIFDIGYVEKQPVAWKEYCAKYWLKELQESMDRSTGCHDITEILLKTALNTIQSIYQQFKSYDQCGGFCEKTEWGKTLCPQSIDAGEGRKRGFSFPSDIYHLSEVIMRLVKINQCELFQQQI